MHRGVSIESNIRRKLNNSNFSNQINLDNILPIIAGNDRFLL